jgi:hypothetical protein
VASWPAWPVKPSQAGFQKKKIVYFLWKAGASATRVPIFAILNLPFSTLATGFCRPLPATPPPLFVWLACIRAISTYCNLLQRKRAGLVTCHFFEVFVLY